MFLVAILYLLYAITIAVVKGSWLFVDVGVCALGDGGGDGSDALRVRLFIGVIRWGVRFGDVIPLPLRA